MMLALTSCGSGTPEIIGVTHTLYLNGDGEPQVVTPIERIKEKNKSNPSKADSRIKPASTISTTV